MRIQGSWQTAGSYESIQSTTSIA